VSTDEVIAAPAEIRATTTATATVDIIIPVLNEERALPGCLATLTSYLRQKLPFSYHITVVDNGSTDATARIAEDFARTDPRVSVIVLDVRGRGAAVKAGWGASDCDVVVYMDVDLSTGLDALLPLVAPLASGHCELSIGTRLAHGSRVNRSFKRELISRTYNSIVRYGFGLRCSDTQLGFKAARADAIRPLLAAAQDDRWFFDTELLLLAEHNGLRVHEVPVDWVEDIDSRVRLGSAAMANIRGLVRMNRAILDDRATVDVPRAPDLRATHPDALLGRPRSVQTAKLISFVVIGLVSTLLYVLAYVVLRGIMPPGAANLCALVTVGVCNTEANRRWTFTRSGGPRFILHLRALAVFVATYLLTTFAVVAMKHLVARAGLLLELATLLVTYGVITIARFVILDRWVFARRRRTRVAHGGQ